MKKLNFFPFYDEYLKDHKKTTTFRLSNTAPYKKGDEVVISIGWTEDEAVPVSHAVIKSVDRRRIRDLGESDFEGESPDCKSPETTRLVLSCIYKRVLNNDDVIWVVKFDHKI